MGAEMVFSGISRVLAAALAVAIAVTGGMLPAQASTVVEAAPALRSAPPASNFDPGFIISDALMFDGYAMDEGQVQSFLNSQVPNCAQGATCLKNFVGNTGVKPATPMCTEYVGAANETAARIIVKVAQACGISPKVLLVLLQKEQSLVTSTSPSQSQFDYATGANCPDTAPCDPATAGLFNQLFSAAYLLKRYTTPPGTGPGTEYSTNYAARYPVGATSQILYNPNSDCGTTGVFIKNNATHSLYIYTPYTPNAAAMANLYGVGDDCSSYGNRNFWRLYYDWFGNPQGGDPSFIRAIFADLLGRVPDDSVVRDWDWLLQNGRTRASLAGDILYSDEYRTQRIEGAYWNVLHRGSDANGMAYWLSVTGRGGLPIDEVEHYFLRSDEYYASIGGQPQQFVEDVFQRMLARSASANDQLYWAPIVQQYGREAVVWAIYNSPESSFRRVDAMYQKLMARSADQGGKEYWGPRVVQFGDNEIRAAIVDSVEYSDRAKQRYPAS